MKFDCLSHCLLFFSAGQMDNPLVREAVVSACSIIAQTAAAANGPFQHSAARKQAEEKEMLIWDTRVKETIVSFVDALPEDQISSNDWWENIVFQQPESRFISDFRMTKNRFKDVCVCCLLLCDR